MQSGKVSKNSLPEFPGVVTHVVKDRLRERHAFLVSQGMDFKGTTERIWQGRYTTARAEDGSKIDELLDRQGSRGRTRLRLQSLAQLKHVLNSELWPEDCPVFLGQVQYATAD